MTLAAEAFDRAWQYHQANDWPRAEQFYLEALRADPRHADAWCFLGAAYHTQGKLVQAEEKLRRALQLVPDFPTAHNLLGIVLAQQGRLEEAAAPFRELLGRHPNDAEAHNNLGNLLALQGQYDDAAFHCRRALALMPNFAAAHNNLGNALRQQGKQEEAITHFEEALRLHPSFVEAHLNLGGALHDKLRLAEAETHYRAALQARPSNKLRVVLATLLIPVYQSLEEMRQRRQRLADNIQQLRRENVAVDLVNDEPALDVPTLFYLAYQGLNDRDIHREFGRLFRPLQPPLQPPKARSDGSAKIKVGFISRFFKRHTIGHWMLGLVQHLSRDDFEVTVLSVGRYEDKIASSFRQSADRYVELPTHLPTACRLIAEQRLDILCYTDIGMEAVTYTLALSRLAPIQCVTLGHPVTTGIDAMDYYISTEDLESEESAQHYTEKLVRLKKLPIYFYRPDLPSSLKGREFFGLTNDDHVYVCLQSLFKFHPDFDDLLIGILRGDPRALLVLSRWEAPHWAQIVRQRLAAKMPDIVDRLRFMPLLGHNDYLNLLARADVQLDPIPFGGGSTSYEGLALGIPIVTLPSKFLRGRITYSFYKHMNVLDCVAKTPQEYIDIAVRLGTDTAYRNAIRQKILAANTVLYENSEGIRELEQFFKEAVKRARSERTE